VGVPWVYWIDKDAACSLVGPQSRANREYEDEGFVGEFWGSAGAGVLFRALESKRFLLMLRSGEVEQPGVWGIPGGAVPRSRSGKRMDLWAAARQEAVEETGWDGGGAPRGSFRWEDPRGSGFTFTTFLVDTLLEFEPELNWESDDYAWVTLDEARGMDLHPGVQWLVEQMS
jgi:8-oxo-dGTP pyrophosphatase MutT (NUDIX family)